MKHGIGIAAILLLSACSASYDMQGVDPYDYYAAHPIKNTVVTRTATAVAHFAPKESMLAEAQSGQIRAALRDASPAAAETVYVWLSDADMKNEARKQSLAALLRGMGYEKHVSFLPWKDKAPGDVQVDVIYAAVVAPDCPDWRTSPVTSYSNTHQGNFECSQEVNLGLMVADPHDLVRGTGSNLTPDTERAARVIEDYNSGKDYSPGTLNAGAGSGGSNSSPSGASTSAVSAGVSGLTGGGGTGQ